MFEKAKLNGKIKKLQREIAEIERKRARSQSALVEAILTKTTPGDQDVDFFNRYTEQINELRNEMQELQMQLKKV